MQELLTKLSSYNILNNLFPGAAFVVAAEKLALVDLTKYDLITKVLFYYFVGVCIGRLGSLLLEPLAKKTGLVKHSSYPAYVRATKQDTSIAILLETANTYRTVAAGAVVLLALFLWKNIGPDLTAWANMNSAITIAVICVLFVASYRKQSQYVKKRVDAHPNSEPG